MNSNDKDLQEISDFLKKNDLPSYWGLIALNKMKGSSVDLHRENIISFLKYKYKSLPISLYVSRVSKLREMQIEFEKKGTYQAQSYSDVSLCDVDEYNIALLLSFILTNHRFEILSALEDFLRQPSSGPRCALSIGFGTGYELKLMKEILTSWQYEAYDASKESFEYASDLLNFFGCNSDGLHTDYFPLEVSEFPNEKKGVFSKIVACELLEHLEQPELALKNMALALHENGQIFTTMAINIAQEDHVFHYRSAEDARKQIEHAGLTIVKEFVTPLTIMPFKEEDRGKTFTRGNYVCVLSKR